MDLTTSPPAVTGATLAAQLRCDGYAVVRQPEFSREWHATRAGDVLHAVRLYGGGNEEVGNNVLAIAPRLADPYRGQLFRETLTNYLGPDPIESPHCNCRLDEPMKGAWPGHRDFNHPHYLIDWWPGDWVLALYYPAQTEAAGVIPGSHMSMAHAVGDVAGYRRVEIGPGDILLMDGSTDHCKFASTSEHPRPIVRRIFERRTWPHLRACDWRRGLLSSDERRRTTATFRFGQCPEAKPGDLALLAGLLGQRSPHARIAAAASIARLVPSVESYWTLPKITRFLDDHDRYVVAYVAMALAEEPLPPVNRILLPWLMQRRWDPLTTRESPC